MNGIKLIIGKLKEIILLFSNNEKYYANFEASEGSEYVDDNPILSLKCGSNLFFTIHELVEI